MRRGYWRCSELRRAVDRSRADTGASPRPRLPYRRSRRRCHRAIGRDGLLPAITFIFSRAGCERAVLQCLAPASDSPTPAEAAEVADVGSARRRSRGGPARPGLSRMARSSAARHRGTPRRHAPDVQGDRRGAVHARPGGGRSSRPRPSPLASTCRRAPWCSRAREVERRGTRRRHTGGVHAAHRPRRARGIDVEGHAVVLWTPRPRSGDLAGLARPGRTRFGQASGRRTTWLSIWSARWAGTRRTTARVVVRAVPGRPRGSRPGPPDSVRSEALDGYLEAMSCNLGDFEEYARLRKKLSELEGSAAPAAFRGPTRRGSAIS